MLQVIKNFNEVWDLFSLSMQYCITECQYELKTISEKDKFQ